MNFCRLLVTIQELIFSVSNTEFEGGDDGHGLGDCTFLVKQAQPSHKLLMCWTLVAEEPHRSTILNLELELEHCPLKANARCLIFPLHQGKMSSVQPLSGLDFPSQGSRG
jgi:hypothetical protein